MGSVAGQVVTRIQEAAGLDVQARSSRISRTRAEVVFDDDAGHAHMHPDRLSHRFVP
jgi:hypothetical protein